jgi:hypothetical protein
MGVSLTAEITGNAMISQRCCEVAPCETLRCIPLSNSILSSDGFYLGLFFDSENVDEEWD